MVAEVIKPNVITYNRFLAQLLAQMIKLNVITYNRFLILAQMIKPNVITYNLSISALTKTRNPQRRRSP